MTGLIAAVVVTFHEWGIPLAVAILTGAVAVATIYLAKHTKALAKTSEQLASIEERRANIERWRAEEARCRRRLELGVKFAREATLDAWISGFRAPDVPRPEGADFREMVPYLAHHIDGTTKEDVAVVQGFLDLVESHDWYPRGEQPPLEPAIKRLQAAVTKRLPIWRADHEAAFRALHVAEM